MTETLITAIKTAVMAAIMQSMGLYAGAAFIALIAALARLAYTAEQPSFEAFGRFFMMGLAIAMLMVHVGQLREWDTETTIIISGVSAFLCKEGFNLLMASKDSFFTKVLEKLK